MKSEYILTGYYSVDELKNKFAWFNDGYDKYSPNKEIINELKKQNKNTFIMIFAGNWCSDTHELLPKFYKTADLAGIVNHQVYFIDRNKDSPDNLEDNYKINLVPTVIIIENGVEKGRIEESVKQSIEQDILEIIKAQ